MRFPRTGRRRILPASSLALLAVLTTLMMPLGKTLWYRMLGISGSVSILEVTPTPTERGGGEGCTPGFWKQEHHFSRWPEPYTPSTPLGYFSSPGETSPLTMLEALELGGGGLNALWRHTVAALLNAGHPSIDFPYETGQILEMLLGALGSGDYEGLKDLFAAANEGACPLGDADNPEEPTPIPSPTQEGNELPAEDELPTETPTATPAEPPEVCPASFWVEPDHWIWWAEPYQPGTGFAATFGLELDFGLSLKAALELEGEELPGLMREAVTGLLNAASEDLEYPLSTEQVVQAFGDAFGSEDAAKIANLFEYLLQANQGECPLGATPEPTPTQTPWEDREPHETVAPTATPGLPPTEPPTPEPTPTPTATTES
jgi:hypothetical protein